MTAENFAVQKISILNFRNLHLTYTPAAGINIISGGNGEGKTNFVEALFYVSNLSSFRGARTGDMIALGQDRALVDVWSHESFLARHFSVILSRPNHRQIEVDGKRPRALFQYRQNLPVVAFHPLHLQLIYGSPELRRNFLDDALSRIDQIYEKELKAYQRTLRHANRLLKGRVERRALWAYYEPLAQHGEEILAQRERLTQALAPRVRAAFAAIMGEEASFTLAYQSSVEAKHLFETLRERVEHDMLRGSVSVGPHVDDFLVQFSGKRARTMASQGQQRALALSLKLAEHAHLTDFYGRKPILLLDDVSSELDQQRTAHFLALLRNMGCQTFITTTHREYLLLPEASADAQMRAGQLSVDGAPLGI